MLKSPHRSNLVRRDPGERFERGDARRKLLVADPQERLVFHAGAAVAVRAVKRAPTERARENRRRDPRFELRAGLLRVVAVSARAQQLDLGLSRNEGDVRVGESC